MTCHVCVDPAFAIWVCKSSGMLHGMPDFAGNMREMSRLSCQIRIRDDRDGLRVTTPESQHRACHPGRVNAASRLASHARQDLVR
jgi:2Fe-2S ferredoxin